MLRKVWILITLTFLFINFSLVYALEINVTPLFEGKSYTAHVPSEFPFKVLVSDCEHGEQFVLKWFFNVYSPDVENATGEAVVKCDEPASVVPTLRITSAGTFPYRFDVYVEGGGDGRSRLEGNVDVEPLRGDLYTYVEFVPNPAYKGETIHLRHVIGVKDCSDPGAVVKVRDVFNGAIRYVDVKCGTEFREFPTNGIYDWAESRVSADGFVDANVENNVSRDELTYVENLQRVSGNLKLNIYDYSLSSEGNLTIKAGVRAECDSGTAYYRLYVRKRNMRGYIGWKKVYFSSENVECGEEKEVEIPITLKEGNYWIEVSVLPLNVEGDDPSDNNFAFPLHVGNAITSGDVYVEARFVPRYGTTYWLNAKVGYASCDGGSTRVLLLWQPFDCMDSKVVDVECNEEKEVNLEWFDAGAWGPFTATVWAVPLNLIDVDYGNNASVATLEYSGGANENNGEGNKEPFTARIRFPLGDLRVAAGLESSYYILFNAENCNTATFNIDILLYDEENNLLWRESRTEKVKCMGPGDNVVRPLTLPALDPGRYRLVVEGNARSGDDVLEGLRAEKEFNALGGGDVALYVPFYTVDGDEITVDINVVPLYCGRVYFTARGPTVDANESLTYSVSFVVKILSEESQLGSIEGIVKCGSKYTTQLTVPLPSSNVLTVSLVPLYFVEGHSEKNNNSVVIELNGGESSGGESGGGGSSGGSSGGGESGSGGGEESGEEGGGGENSEDHYPTVEAEVSGGSSGKVTTPASMGERSPVVVVRRDHRVLEREVSAIPVGTARKSMGIRVTLEKIEPVSKGTAFAVLGRSGSLWVALVVLVVIAAVVYASRRKIF